MLGILATKAWPEARPLSNTDIRRLMRQAAFARFGNEPPPSAWSGSPTASETWARTTRRRMGEPTELDG